MYCLAALAALTVADLWTKQWAVNNLSRERLAPVGPLCEPDAEGHVSMQRARVGWVVLVEDYLEFRYAENCGAAFGMLNNAPAWFRSMLFLTAATMAVFALLWLFVRGSGGPLFAVSVPLVVSGALGNLVDRIQNGYVVDFIRFHIHDVFEWPTFNLADSVITVGVILLLIDGFRHSGEKQPAET